MDDLISRKAAIDAINTLDKFGVDERDRLVRWHEGLEFYVHLRDVLTAIVNLPSTQPETHGKRTETHACDCISREAAIDALDCINGVEEVLKALPSAQPEQHEIEYSECANAMLKMWIDNVLTDGEYSRIMDKLNAYWAERREE